MCRFVIQNLKIQMLSQTNDDVIPIERTTMSIIKLVLVFLSFIYIYINHAGRVCCPVNR